MLALFCVIGKVSSDCVLISLARAELLTASNENCAAASAVMEMDQANVQNSPSNRSCSYHSIDYDCCEENEGVQKRVIVGNQVFEVSELCKIFWGERAFVLIYTSVLLYLYGLLSAYTSVFSTAMARCFPIYGDDFDYVFFTIVYATFMVPISTLDMSEQGFMQMFLSMCRLLLLGKMILTMLSATISALMFVKSEIFIGQKGAAGTDLIKLSGLPNMTPAIVFAFAYQQSIPGLAHLMQRREKLGNVFGWTITLIGIWNAIMAVSGSWFFGEGTEESSNLNWLLYDGLLSTVIKYVIVSFPAVDVVSAFPLIALTLGNTMLSFYCGEDTAQVSKSFET